MGWLVVALYVLGAIQSALLAVAIDKAYPPEKRWTWQGIAFIGAAWPAFALALAVTCRHGIRDAHAFTPALEPSDGSAAFLRNRANTGGLGRHKAPEPQESVEVGALPLPASSTYDTQVGSRGMSGGVTQGLAEPSAAWIAHQAPKHDLGQVPSPKTTSGDQPTTTTGSPATDQATMELEDR